MLKLKNIHHTYDNKQHIFKGLSYSFDQKKYVVIGPSGVGKTTLLYIAGGLLSPTKGYIKNDYIISFVFQNANFLADFTFRENMEIVCDINKVKWNFEDIAYKLGVVDMLDRYPNQVSGGQKQRIAIARAIALGANFILADEPTGNLDQANAKLIIKFFDDLARDFGIGFLISTHDMNWLEIADYKLQIIDNTLQESSAF